MFPKTNFINIPPLHPAPGNPGQRQVELILPATLRGKFRLGDVAEITPEAGAAKALTARITVIDPVVDAASRTFGIRLELRNPNHQIPAGVRCQAEPRNVAALEAPAPGPAATDPPRR